MIAPTKKIKSKGKVAIVVGTFPLLSETFVLNHITDLIDAGFEVDIYSFKLPKEQENVHPSVKEYNLMDKVNRILIARNKKGRKRQLRRVVLRNILRHPLWLLGCLSFGRNETGSNILKTEPFLDKNYDVIHCHFGNHAYKIIEYRKIFKKIKFFVTFHGYDVRLGLREKGVNYRQVFHYADGIISICNFNRKKLIAMGCPSSKLIDLPNGVNIEKFYRKTKDTGKQIVITSITRLVPSKNVFFALKVMRELKKEGNNFNYYIIGDGSFKAKIIKMIKEYDLDETVHLLGAQNRDEVIDQLSKTDLFFLPSMKEAFPVCLLEAQAMGIPVVAADAGGVREGVLHGQTGYVIAPNDINDAKSRFSTFFNDQDMIKKMGNKAREFIVNNFNIKKLNERLFSLYNTACK